MLWPEVGDVRVAMVIIVVSSDVLLTIVKSGIELICDQILLQHVILYILHTMAAVYQERLGSVVLMLIVRNDNYYGGDVMVSSMLNYLFSNIVRCSINYCSFYYCCL
jgi:hypothetical protein